MTPITIVEGIAVIIGVFVLVLVIASPSTSAWTISRWSFSIWPAFEFLIMRLPMRLKSGDITRSEKGRAISSSLAGSAMFELPPIASSTP